MTSGDDARLQARVQEHLQPGETFRAAVWAGRAEGHPPSPITRADISLIRLRRRDPGPRRGVAGPPRSRAVTLDEHIRTVNDPRIVALTDRRLLVLAQRLTSWRALLNPTPDSPLRLRWECPRAELAATAEKSGRLTLTFTDGSSITVLTPSAAARPFLAAAGA
ncbi:hypothetical protein [Actinoplanes sp. URMC 104]|uniref:hypothetical protein n=1 Tax=Actinoplanes sp. URMC 104 TaxID=3423409 RepID=UPI003F1CE5E3